MNKAVSSDDFDFQEMSIQYNDTLKTFEKIL